MTATRSDTALDTSHHNRDCYSCGERMPQGECSESKSPCGHHCNHSWTHDECCWCRTAFGEGGEETIAA